MFSLHRIALTSGLIHGTRRCLFPILLMVLVAPLVAGKFSGEGEIQREPLSPEESWKRLRVESGLRVELVAAEPLVEDPVDLAFDDQGRMYVAETVGYNRESATPRSRVRRLEDTDGDGRMDKAIVFAEDLEFAQGIAFVQGAILVTVNRGVMLLRDTDGDGQADLRETLFHAEASPFVDHQLATPRRGLDNWMYINHGLGKQRVWSPHRPDQKLDLASYNFRYLPGTTTTELTSGMGQFGNTFDNWGRQFFSMNRNPAMMAVMPYRYLTRNPYAFLTVGHEDVAPFGGEARVYPLKTFRTTSTAHAGTFTAACGISAYRGDLLGEVYVNNLFVCDPTGELVTRWILEPSGASFQARRAVPGQEFLASDDEWFRPVNTMTGPDGALYVVDMYRRFIDGARFFPDDYVAANDMGAGMSRGRIYRIVPESAPVRRFGKAWRIPTSSPERLALLAHPNGWHRDMAQQLIVESGDRSVIPALEAMLTGHDDPRGRLHAFWTLEGLHALSTLHLVRALADSSPGVVENALWLAPHYITEETIFKMVITLMESREPRVRFAAALAAGERAEARESLVRLAAKAWRDPWIRSAVASYRFSFEGDFLASLLADSSFTQGGEAGQVDLVHRLAMGIGAAGKATELRPLFVRLKEKGGNDRAWWQMAAVAGIAEGLRRQPDRTLPVALATLLATPPPELSDVTEGVQAVFATVVTTLQDRTRPLSERLAAIPMLQHLPPAQAVSLGKPLLTNLEPAEMQKAILESLTKMDRKVVTPILYERLKEMGTEAKTIAMQFLQRSPAELIEKIRVGMVNPALVGPEARWLIANSKDASIRKAGQEIFGNAESDRKALIHRYAGKLSGLTGSAESGRAVFGEACALCHRVRGFGNELGPDISDVRIKSTEMLLGDILDPNAAIEPRYELHSFKTSDGRALAGIVASESSDSVVLRGPGWQETLLRKEVVSSEGLGMSLMPPGLEGNLTEQRMADLIAFLKSDIMTP